MTKAKKPQPASTARTGSDTVTVVIEVPALKDVGGQNAARRLDMNLTTVEARAVLHIQRALDQQHARLLNGRPVYRTADVIRYLLQRAAAELGVEV